MTHTTTTCDYCPAPAAWRIHSGETSLACDTCYREMFDENERASFTWEAERLQPADFDTYPRCLGVGKRFCANLPTKGTPYCEACHAALDALHDRARGCVPPAPTQPSPISIATTPSGMYHLRYGATTIGVCSADALEALRLYLAAPTIEAYDDALTMIEELRAA